MIILLTGPNDFAIHEAVHALTASFSAKHGTSCIERVSGEELTVAQLPDLLQGMSLFASHRLVIVRGASANKSVWEQIGQLAQTVSEDITLVLVEPSPDKRTKTYKALLTKAHTQDYPELPESALSKWLLERTKKLGGDISQADVNYLIARIGVNQWQLSNELDKLLAFQAGITRGLINELTEASTEANAFQLLDLALAGDTQRTQSMLDALSVNEDPYKFFGLLSSQVYALILLAEAGSSKTIEDIAKDTGLHPFVLKKSKSTAQRLGAAHLRKVVDEVARCDMQLKSTGHDVWQLIGLTLGKITAK